MTVYTFFEVWPKILIKTCLRLIVLSCVTVLRNPHSTCLDLFVYAYVLWRWYERTEEKKSIDYLLIQLTYMLRKK